MNTSKNILVNIIDNLETRRRIQGYLLPSDENHLSQMRQRFAEIELEEKVKEAGKADKSREMRQRRGRGRYGEQRLAKKVGGKVVGRSKYIVFDSGKSIQINCQKPPDVVTEMFAFESKWLSHTPANIRKVIDQAIRNCPEGLIPVAVIGDRLERETYYIMTEKDWLELHGGK